MVDHVRGRIAKNSQVSPKAQLHHPVDIADNVVVYGSCRIGAFSYLNVGTVLYSHSELGAFCSVGRNAQIGMAKHPVDFLSTHPFQFSDGLFKNVPHYAELQTTKWAFHTPTVVGSDVWIGANALISSGVTIGHGAVIAAGAVVTDDVGPYEIVGGVPARLIRLRFAPPIVARLLATEWWTWDLSCLKTLDFKNIEACLTELERRMAAGLVTKRILPTPAAAQAIPV